MNTVLFLQSWPRQLEYNIVLLYKPLIENSQLIKLGFSGIHRDICFLE